MSFASYIFILLFLPVFLVLYFGFGKFGNSCSKGIIIAAGIVFYVFTGTYSVFVLCISLLINICMLVLLRKDSSPGKKKLFFITAIALNVLLLAGCKYVGFIADIVFPSGKHKLGHDLILPVGISFFTFQQIMYVVSVWKGELRQFNYVDYLAYILYFPKIIMGPLMEPADLIEQLNDRKKLRVIPVNIAGGLKLFSIGLFKKMVFADTFAKAVDWGFAKNISDITSGDIFLVMLFFVFQIYFDFSSYSDMATGVSKMINIMLPINFDSPYKACSIKSFWNRWHISLSKFFTKYIYIPLGGSRKGRFRTALNIMTVFLISGLWHGVNWTFILWGGINGVLLIIEQAFKDKINKLSESVRWGCTFFVENILCLLFRSESIAQWWNLIKKMFCFQDMSVSLELIKLFMPDKDSILFSIFGLKQLEQIIRGFSMNLFIAASFIICLVLESAYKRSEKLNRFNMVLCAVLFLYGFLCLSREPVFYYWGF